MVFLQGPKGLLHLAPDAGRLAAYRPGADAWTLTPFVAGGVVQITTMPGDGGLWFGTTRGQVYRTTDLEHFDLRFQAEPGHDVRLYSVQGRPVAVSAVGVVYDSWQEVLRLPDAEYLRLEPLAGGLVGVLNRPDGAYGVKMGQ